MQPTSATNLNTPSFAHKNSPYPTRPFKSAMDQEDEQGRPRRGPGRPPKVQSRGRVGRPRKNEGGYYQARGWRAPKRSIIPPPTDRVTRSSTGAVRRLNYDQRLRARRSNTRRRQATSEGSTNAAASRPDESDPDSPGDRGLSGDLSSQQDEQSDFPMPYPDSDPDPVISDLDVESDLSKRRSVDTLPDLGRGQEESIPETPSDSRPKKSTDRGIRKAPKRPLDENPELGVPHRPAKRLAWEGPRSREESMSDGEEDKQRPWRHDLDWAVEKTIEDKLPPITSFGGGLRGKYWNNDLDEAFLGFWQGKYRRFGKCKSAAHELRLWKLMLVRYNRLPPHLFTYGLKLGQDCYEAPESIGLSIEASQLLQQICVHPVWGDDLDSLRYVLQKAAEFSVEGHIEPVGPPPSTMATERVLDLLPASSSEERDHCIGKLQYNLWLENKPDTRKEFRELIGMLQVLIEPQQAEEEAEKALFILPIPILQSVLFALEMYRVYSFGESTSERLESFWEYHESIRGRIEPRELDDLVGLKGDWEFGELRDVEIRKVMRKCSDGDFLYDIPHLNEYCDKVPLYYHHLGFDKRVLPVLRGEVMDPKRATLQELDRKDEVRAKALDDFSARILEVISGHRGKGPMATPEASKTQSSVPRQTVKPPSPWQTARRHEGLTVSPSKSPLETSSQYSKPAAEATPAKDQAKSGLAEVSEMEEEPDYPATDLLSEMYSISGEGLDGRGHGLKHPLASENEFKETHDIAINMSMSYAKLLEDDIKGSMAAEGLAYFNAVSRARRSKREFKEAEWALGEIGVKTKQ
ncbi:hypothetical protein HD806DRAFT_544751 [Xylariaceae sp. AK1471]|nr:hypothetical protein HD806DRAFT_544751 [Xylariaceae sp. AK1471]